MHVVQSVLGCLLLVYSAFAAAAGTMSPDTTKAPTGSEGAEHKIEAGTDAWKAIDDALTSGKGIKDLKDDMQRLPGDPEGMGHHPGNSPDNEENRRRRRLGIGDPGFKEKSVKASRRRRRTGKASRRRRRTKKNKKAIKTLTDPDHPTVMENHEGPNAWVPKEENYTSAKRVDGEESSKERIHYDPPM